MEESKEASSSCSSWVWKHFLRSSGLAKCNRCAKVLPNGKSTGSLEKHLKTKHSIYPRKPQVGSSKHNLPQTNDLSSEHIMEEEQLSQTPGEPPAKKKKKQLQIDSFINHQHSLRNDVMRLICENVSLNHIVSSETFRRLFSRAYPSDIPLPKSGSTLTKYLNEDAEKVRNQLRTTFRTISSSGRKVSVSFDEALVIGTDRYITINVHHGTAILGKSKIAALGLARITSRATGAHLSNLITERLQSVGLSTREIVAAATDGGSNVLKAVDMLGLEKQQCYAHGLDLVVRKVIHGENALVFDAAIFNANDDEEVNSNEEADDDEESGSEDGTLDLGVVRRLRRTVREFKRKPVLMDEIRRVTAKDEYNEVELRPMLDCKTQLLKAESALAEILLESLKKEIKKRGTILSTALAMLEDPKYDFNVELAIGQPLPSDDDILEILSDITDADSDSSSQCAIEPTKFAGTDEWDSVMSSPEDADSDREHGSCKKDDLKSEYAIFKAGGGRGRLLKLCREVLRAIPPTSVQPERDCAE